MQRVIDHLLGAYPLLKHLTVWDTRCQSGPEALPPFLGFSLSVMDKMPKQPLCFVLPKRGDAARLAIVLHALIKLRLAHKAFLESLAHDEFHEGQTVCIHPSKEVFVYEGVRAQDPSRFWLSEIDSARGNSGYRVSFPMKMDFPLWAIQRLELTTRKRPKGDIRKRGKELWEPHGAPIDALIGTKTFGNLGWAKNVGILLDGQGEFAEFAASTALKPVSEYVDTTTLEEIIPFGSVSSPTSPGSGWLRKTTGAGEPLIAVTHSAELLANYCIDQPARSKLVVANGLSRFHNNRQAYDDIAETQSLVLFADACEKEMIETLGSAPIPCRFWWLTPAEIAAGQDGTLCERSGLVANISRWASNQESLTLEALPCDNPQLDSACLLLERLHAAVRAAEDGPLTKLTSRAWRMLNDACTVVEPLNEEERQRALQQVDALRQELERFTAWLTPEQKELLGEVLNTIANSFSASAMLGLAKGATLYRIIQSCRESGTKCALIARTENQVAELRAWLTKKGFAAEPEVYSPRSLPHDAALETIICGSWLGGESMKRVVESLVAPTIKVIAYPFESRWLKTSRGRLSQRPRSERITAAEKKSLLPSGEGSVDWPEDGKETPTAESMVVEPEIWGFEQRFRDARKGSHVAPTFAADTLPARYVGFVGDTYAYLTANHRIVVGSDLVSGRLRSSQRLPERVISELKMGDFVVFPESGDREFILERRISCSGRRPPGSGRSRTSGRMKWTQKFGPAVKLDFSGSAGCERPAEL